MAGTAGTPGTPRVLRAMNDRAALDLLLEHARFGRKIHSPKRKKSFT